jgi:4-hydroxybenzoate polyprenyltransferase
MRLEKPVGSWLLAWPGLWSIALAASPGHLPDPYLSLLFAGGAVLLRGTGCTINDLLDRRIDARVERTRTRPLPSGAVTPLQALGFVGLQLSLGLVILAQLNGAAQALGALSLALVGCYPLMKRVTWWPQAFLGLTINWGALMGAAAASPEATAAAPPALQLTAKALSAAATDPSAFFAAAGGNATAALGAFAATPALLPAAALYGSGIAWTLVYDTIYAHQDIRDDRRVGVKSTARLFAERGVSKPALAFFAAAQSALLATAGVLAGAGPAYFAGAAAAGGHVAWQVASVDLSNGEDCARKFAANKWTGALVWGGIVLDRLLAAAGAPLVGG